VETQNGDFLESEAKHFN